MSAPKSSPYRAPGARPPEPPKRTIDADGLDAAAFEKRLAKRDEVEERARIERIAMANRQLRLRAGIASAVGIVLGLFVLPEVLDGVYVGRGTGRLFVTCTTMVAWAVAAFVGGAGETEDANHLPRPVLARQIVAAVIGAGIGLAMIWR